MNVKTLNFGVPGDGAVNVFEFYHGAASEMIKTMLSKEDYEGAGILDRRYKLGKRESPLFQSEGMEYLWSSEFDMDDYVKVKTERIFESFLEDETLKAEQIRFGKIEILAQQQGVSVDVMLKRAIQKLVYFDSRCAFCIKETMTFEEFCQLHETAANVVQDTIGSILEELEKDPNTIFYLQEINVTVIQRLSQLLRSKYEVSYNDEGSTAIITPLRLGTVEPFEFPNFGGTFLHEEICVLKVEDTILISVHCSAKTKEEAIKEGKTVAKNMEDQLDLLRAFIQTMTENGKNVLLGGDFNQRITDEKMKMPCEIFPPSAVSTTFKERGAMQTQFKKINKKDAKSKDCICVFGQKYKVVDCRVRSLYKDGISYASYAMNQDAAVEDSTLKYPERLQYPYYGVHFPDHDVIEVVIN
jgi:exonuclease III